jgi:hypothetical protein
MARWLGSRASGLPRRKEMKVADLSGLGLETRISPLLPFCGCLSADGHVG